MNKLKPGVEKQILRKKQISKKFLIDLPLKKDKKLLILRAIT